MNYDFAQNTIKLRRILDKMPNATVEEVRAEYIKQGGLLNKEEIVITPVSLSVETKIPVEVKKTTIKEVVKKAVKKVTKKK